MYGCGGLLKSFSWKHTQPEIEVSPPEEVLEIRFPSAAQLTRPRSVLVADLDGSSPIKPETSWPA